MNKSESIHDIVLSLLPGIGNGVNASTRLLEIGLIDSTKLVDIIFEVEKRCDVAFNPERIEIEEQLTLGSLISAFDG